LKRTVAAALVAFVVPVLTAQAPPYDLVIRGGRVVDGSGNPWHRADVAIRGDTIVAVKPAIETGGARVLEARGQIVCPGFIDLHTHARRAIFDLPSADNYVRQGVTTLLEGNDGDSVLPVREFLDRVSATRPAVNVGTFIGQGSVREEVVGRADRAATPEELERMKALVLQGMLEGAFGLSTGLAYVPGTFTPTEEVVELAKAAGASGGIYITHMRNESSKVIESVRETIAIAEKASLPGQITHHKVSGPRNWGKSVETLALVAEARSRGVDVTMDQYPYTASRTGISTLFPSWALEGNREERAARLKDPATRGRIRKAVIDNLRGDRAGGNPKNVVISFSDADRTLEGKSLADLARERGRKPTVENAADVVLEIVEKGGTTRAIYHVMGEADVERILRDPLTMIASDGEVVIFGEAAPHPRSYGTFARVLSAYVREKKVLRLEEAVRKMTSAPAQRIGLVGRGLLRAGMKADIAVFDPATVRDRSTYEKPHQYSEGFSAVLVNGEIVYEEGRMTGARPGRALYGPAFAAER